MAQIKGVSITATTVKELKATIDELRGALLQLSKADEQYDEKVQQLQAHQAKLNEVMALTSKATMQEKQAISAVAGSYDELVAKAAQLRKEWRAIEIGTPEWTKQAEEINKITTQLKDADAAIGNHQRKVGDYTGGVIDAFAQLRGEIKKYKAELLQAEEGSEEYEQALAKLGEAQFRMKDMTEQAKYAVADVGEVLGAVSKTAQGVVGGFNAMQGVMALAGGESENLQKVMVKLQAGIAIVQGLQGLEGMIDSVKGLQIVLNNGAENVMSFVRSLSAMNKAFLALGIVGAIAAIASWISSLNDASNAQDIYQNKLAEINREQERFKELLDKIKLDNETFSTNLIAKYADEILKAKGNAEQLRAVLLKLREDQEGEREREIQTEVAALLNRRKEIGESLQGLQREIDEASVNVLVNLGYRREVAEEQVKNGFNRLSKAQKEFLDEQLSDLYRSVADRGSAYNKELNDIIASLQRLANEAKTIKATAIVKNAEEEVAKADKLAEQRRRKAEADEKKRLAEAEKAAEQRQKDLDEIAAIEQAAVDSMQPRIAQELEALRRKYEEQKALYDKYGKDTANLTESYEQDKLAIINKYNNELAQAVAESINALVDSVEEGREAAEDELTSWADTYLKGVDAERQGIEKNIEAVKQAEAEKLRYANISKDTEKERAKAIYDIKQQSLFEEAAILRQGLESGVLYGEQRVEAEERIAQIERDIAYNTAEYKIEQNQRAASTIVRVLSSSANAMGNILGSIADMYEQEGEANQEAMEKAKNLRIAGATMDMLGGVVAALSGLFTTKSGPWDIVLAGIQAATILASGIANITKIKQTDVSGKTSGGTSGTSAIVSAPAIVQQVPITRTLTGVAEEERLNQASRVYVVYDDIAQVGRKVEVTETETTF